MAIAYNIIERRPDLGRTIVDITLDGSYSAGGYAIDAKSVGMLGTPRAMDLQYKHATATSSNVAQYDASTGKVLVFEVGAAGPAVECVAGDITSSHKIRATVYGDPLL